jgi:uncharacterized protein (TIGR02444 family)
MGGLWDWTLGAYAQGGTPEATLRLQDEFGQNTSFLLWAAWAEGADAKALAEGAKVARAWEGAVLKPIRDVRRTLKPSFAGIDDGAREGLREDVKAAELRAERVLMESLERLAGSASGGLPALEALKAASAAWGSPAPDDALAQLAGALS